VSVASPDLLTTNQRGNLPILDLIRFSAALLVLFGHTRGVFLVGIDSVSEPNVFIRTFYLMSGLQHEGVVLFFVVSGFLVGGSIWQQMRQHSFKSAAYLLNRFTRIYLVYIPALIVIGVITTVGAAFFADTRLFAERPLFPSGVSAGWTWEQIPCHLFSVQGVLCDAWGADPPLWSLGFEWTFYLLAPVAFSTILIPMQWVARIMWFVALSGIVYALHRINASFDQWLAIWLLGVAASVIARRWPVPLLAALVGLALCFVAMFLSRTKILSPDTTDAMVTIGLTLALSCRILIEYNFSSRVINRGARFSYSLYLVHLPLCILVGAMLERLAGWPATLVQPDGRGIAAFAATVSAALLTSWLFACCTEDYTAEVRRRIARLVLR
jgi:peptidoglycan/LPS O-acetylase OafA/YrhL